MKTIGINEKLLGKNKMDIPDYVTVGNHLVSNDGNPKVHFYFGTIQECEKILNTRIYWSICNRRVIFHDLKVSEFLPPLQDHCLNFKNSYYKLACQLNENDIGNFCRSDSGKKTWSGQILDEGLIKIIKQSLMKDELLFLSTPKEFSDIEYRCWVGNGKLIAYDTYCVKDVERTEPINEETFNQLQGFITLLEMFYSPDECYVVDVCKIKEKLLVVEYNCFSSSSFCKNNASLIPVLEYIRDSNFTDIFNRIHEAT